MTKELKGQITRCKDCGYTAMTYERTHCSKCKGELEVLASEELSDII